MFGSHLITYNISIEETYDSKCSIDLLVNDTDTDLTTIITQNENDINLSTANPLVPVAPK